MPSPGTTFRPRRGAKVECQNPNPKGKNTTRKTSSGPEEAFEHQYSPTPKSKGSLPSSIRKWILCVSWYLMELSLNNIGRIVNTEEEILKAVFPNLPDFFQDHVWLCQRAILAPQNQTNGYSHEITEPPEIPSMILDDVEGLKSKRNGIGNG
ncbi:hypothetical protein TNIN_222011, partial [Trichonephila inaurata madagascariensis]